MAIVYARSSREEPSFTTDRNDADRENVLASQIWSQHVATLPLPESRFLAHEPDDLDQIDRLEYRGTKQTSLSAPSAEVHAPTAPPPASATAAVGGGGGATTSSGIPERRIDLDRLLATATERWLTPTELEVLLLRQNQHPLPITPAKPSSPPPSGTLLLYDRSSTSDYKDDGHSWIRRRNSKKVREDPVKLRIGGKSRVAGMYVHSSESGSFKRRAYHMLDYATGKTAVRPRMTGVKKLGGAGGEGEASLVLVHYLDTVEASRLARARSDGASDDAGGSHASGGGGGKRRRTEAGNNNLSAATDMVVSCISRPTCGIKTDDEEDDEAAAAPPEKIFRETVMFEVNHLLEDPRMKHALVMLGYNPSVQGSMEQLIKRFQDNALCGMRVADYALCLKSHLTNIYNEQTRIDAETIGVRYLLCDDADAVDDELASTPPELDPPELEGETVPNELEGETVFVPSERISNFEGEGGSMSNEDVRRILDQAPNVHGDGSSFVEVRFDRLASRMMVDPDVIFETGRYHVSNESEEVVTLLPLKSGIRVTVLTGFTDMKGYTWIKVTGRYKGTLKYYTLSRHNLVYYSHVGIPPPDRIVDHTKGTANGDRVSNFRPLTIPENNRPLANEKDRVATRKKITFTGVLGVTFRKDKLRFRSELNHGLVPKVSFPADSTLGESGKDDMQAQLFAGVVRVMNEIETKYYKFDGNQHSVGQLSMVQRRVADALFLAVTEVGSFRKDGHVRRLGEPTRQVCDIAVHRLPDDRLALADGQLTLWQAKVDAKRAAKANGTYTFPRVTGVCYRKTCNSYLAYKNLEKKKQTIVYFPCSDENERDESAYKLAVQWRDARDAEVEAAKAKEKKKRKRRDVANRLELRAKKSKTVAACDEAALAAALSDESGSEDDE